MAITTAYQPSRRVVGRLVIALLIVALVIAMALVAHAISGPTRHRVSSVTPAAHSAFLGTVNSGPDSPDGNTIGGNASDLGCPTVVPHTHAC
jgi:hypothetical protein